MSEDLEDLLESVVKIKLDIDDYCEGLDEKLTWKQITDMHLDEMFYDLGVAFYELTEHDEYENQTLI